MIDTQAAMVVGGIVVVAGMVAIVISVYAKLDDKDKKAVGEMFINMEHGPINPALICPHCQEQGHVHTKSVQQKKGISGGKATAALLTGGVSMLATGLSRNEQATEAYCGNCKSTWTF